MEFIIFKRILIDMLWLVLNLKIDIRILLQKSNNLKRS